jgi:hypothetical protein
MSNITVNWGLLMEQDKCLAINVPFTDDQLKELIWLDKKAKHEKVLQWREEYAKKNSEVIINKAMNLWEEDKGWLKILRDEYKKLIWKNVPVAKINDADWIKKAIEDAKDESK